MQPSEVRPGRPFGVTLAILLSALFFSILPMAFVGMRVAIESYVSQQRVLVLPNGDIVTDEGLSGAESETVFESEELALQAAISGGFLLIAFLAWRGRPRQMRFVLMAAVLGLAGLFLWQALEQFNAQERSGGSLDSLLRFLSQGSVLLYVLIPLYVVWYLNRGPARAFYRGYYLPDEAEQWATPTSPQRGVRPADDIASESPDKETAEQSGGADL